MRPSLQLRLGQQLAMTPQLQQAIRLLQLPAIELKQEIQEALYNNPLLELDELESESELADHMQETLVHHETKEPLDNYDLDSVDLMAKEEITTELEIDTSWDDIYQDTSNHFSSSDNEIYVYQEKPAETLQNYLLWQLELTPFSKIDHLIAFTIIEALDDSGYLTLSLDELQQSVNQQKNNYFSKLTPQEKSDFAVDVEQDEIEAVRKRLQHFDPVGVASLNLQECLLFQLARYALDTPHLADAKLILTQHIDLLAKRDHRAIAKATKLKSKQLELALQLIKQLNPHPASEVISNKVDYIIPDVSIIKKDNKLIVSLNTDSLPKIKVNQKYALLAKGNHPDSQYIKSNLQEAKWLLRSIESRNETLLKVTNCIARHQKDFFTYGEEAMKPMVLNDIATELNMHESTISRATTQKFVHTSRGIFELKYFFSSHVNTDDGGEYSSTAIRALIKKLVAAENPAKPLSDNKIAAMLSQQGIQVARRTIAKYRETLNILSSSARKRL